MWTVLRVPGLSTSNNYDVLRIFLTECLANVNKIFAYLIAYLVFNPIYNGETKSLTPFPSQFERNLANGWQDEYSIGNIPVPAIARYKQVQ